MNKQNAKYPYFPIRFALHKNHSIKADHIDCFIDPGNNKNLLTYEILPEYFELFLNISLDYKNKIFIKLSTLTEKEQNQSFRVEKSPDHRRVYMQYEGQMKKEKGILTQLGNGWIERLPKKDETRWYFALGSL